MLLVVQGRIGAIVQLFEVEIALLLQANVEVQWIVELLVEEYTARFAASRTRRRRTKSGNHAVRDEIPVIESAVVKGIEMAVLGIMWLRVHLLLHVQQFRRMLAEWATP